MPAKEKYRTSVDLDGEMVDKFREIQPAHGAMSKFFNACLEKYVEMNETTLEEDVAKVVQEVGDSFSKGESSADEQD